MPVGWFMTLDEVDIFVDSNEASLNKGVYDALRRSGLRVAVRKLDAGDYLIPERGDLPAALIERKTVDDFLNSMFEGRLWSQLARLSNACTEASAVCILLLEGDPVRTLSRRKAPVSAYLRAIETAQSSFRTILIPSPSKEATINWLVARAKAVRKRVKEGYLTPVFYQPKRKARSVDDKIMLIASSIAGKEIGMRLLKHFGSLRNLANASVSELMQVEGVGEARARELFYIFNKNVSKLLENKREE